MADLKQCPNCNKSVVPLKKRTIPIGGSFARTRWSRILVMIMSILLAIFGLAIIINHISNIYYIIGTFIIIFGILFLTISIFLQKQNSRNKPYYLTCPLCGYQWPRNPELRNDLVDLQAYFTNVEDLRTYFENLVADPDSFRRLLIIYGVGGIGKTSLLSMFRLHCQNRNVLVGLVSGDEVKNEIDILSNWVNTLNNQAIEFPAFTLKFNQYRSIQMKIEQNIQIKNSEKISKTAANLLVQTAATSVPFVGVPLSLLGGAGVNTLVGWLHGFLSQSQIDLLLDPVGRLTNNFLDDLASAINAQKQIKPTQPIILMLDVYEQITAFENWLCDLAKRLPRNIVFIIAGRTIPNWNRRWPSWMAQAQIEELRPMNEEVMRELILRYYVTQRGGQPDQSQVQAIVHFARGLPLAVTTSVQLWIQYGIEDFKAVQPQVIADLANQLTKGMPLQIRPILSAAATLRWFNKELLGVIVGEVPNDAHYNELRWFPFVRSRSEGFTLHDLVREILDDNLRVDEPERYKEMHLRAAAYFKMQMDKVERKNADAFSLELLYHTVCAEEDEGIKLFELMAEELVRYRLLNQLRTLLSDLKNYSLRQEKNRLWWEYYNARLAELEGRVIDAEKVYQMIGENDKADPKLRAYSLCDWGSLLRLPHIGKPAEEEKSVQVMERGLNFYSLDSKLVIILTELSGAYRRIGNWDASLEALLRAKKYCSEYEDYYGFAYICCRQKYYHMDRGEWEQGFQAQQDGLDALTKVSESDYLKGELLGRLGVSSIWAGRYVKGEHDLREGLRIAEQLGVVGSISAFLRDLGTILGVQAKYEEADSIFSEALKAQQNYKDDLEGMGILWSFWGFTFLRRGDLAKAKDCLEKAVNIGDNVGEKWNSFYYLVYLGELYEISRLWQIAASYYQRCLDLRSVGRHYFESAALTGLIRIRYNEKLHNAALPLFEEEEKLLQQYNFNDHMASVFLTKGHILWEGEISEWASGFDHAMHFYQKALFHALCYNRFLLDEVLCGNSSSTPLEPIIPHCLDRGKEGLRMLASLRDWWSNEQINSSNLSANNISLLEAELLSRKREPGDNSPQRTVIEQLNQVLGI